MRVFKPGIFNHDYQSNAVSDFLLGGRHRLSGLVSGAWRRGSCHHHRQVLLSDLPLPAAVLRASLPCRVFENRNRGVRGGCSRRRGPAILEIGRGLEIHHVGDLPARSGMGSSSSFTVGLLHALHALYGRMASKHLAMEGIHVEQDILKETVGSQDQVMAAYGGLNHVSSWPAARFPSARSFFRPSARKS